MAAGALINGKHASLSRVEYTLAKLCDDHWWFVPVVELGPCEGLEPFGQWSSTVASERAMDVFQLSPVSAPQVVSKTC